MFMKVFRESVKRRKINDFKGHYFIEKQENYIL